MTIEIATFPPAAGIDAFDWRISTATVTAPGPFSHFAGVDRLLAVVEGQLALSINGQAQSIDLNATSPAHAFPGDIGCFGTPVDDTEVIDLNLMLRRGRWTGTIERIASPRNVSITLNWPCAVILFIDKGRLRWGSDIATLQPWDAIRIDGGGGESITLDSDGAVYVVGLMPA